MTWVEYERKVLDYFTSRFPECKIEKNIKISGRHSKTPREIDILLSTNVFGCSIQLVIECKNWKSKLDVADIGCFIDKLNDVGISKGIIISKLGYSEAAHRRARAEVGLQLQVLNFEDMPSFYSFWATGYRGYLGAIISAPNGWVVNTNVPKVMLQDMICFLHPMEFNSDLAYQKRHFMYFQIYPVIDSANMIYHLKEQDKIVINKFPKSKIKYWNENISKGILTYRQITYAENNYSEYTCGIESNDFFSYFVCMTPIDSNSDDLARLKYVIDKLLLFKMVNVDPTDSHDAWRQFFDFS